METDTICLNRVNKDRGHGKLTPGLCSYFRLESENLPVALAINASTEVTDFVKLLKGA